MPATKNYLTFYSIEKTNRVNALNLILVNSIYLLDKLVHSSHLSVLWEYSTLNTLLIYFTQRNLPMTKTLISLKPVLFVLNVSQDTSLLEINFSTWLLSVSLYLTVLSLLIQDSLNVMNATKVITLNMTPVKEELIEKSVSNQVLITTKIVMCLMRLIQNVILVKMDFPRTTTENAKN